MKGGNMKRTILHSDCNCFYASVEHLHHPELKGKPVAVGGNPEARHGIVLTADYTAKRYGVKTGMALWQAKQICPDIIFLPARMDLYLRFSRMAQEIYSEYTDKIEPFGIDESWLDVSESAGIKGDGYSIAKEISEEYGIEPKRAASLLDIFSCVFQGLIPYGAQVLFACASIKGLNSPFEVVYLTWYPLVLAAFALLSIYVPYVDRVSAVFKKTN